MSEKGGKVGQVPLDDIAAVIVSVPGCTISTNLLDHLARRNVPIVICGQNYLPTSWVLPVQGHNRQFRIMRAQIELSEPRRKRAWQTIIKAKINNQAEALARAGQPDSRLLRLKDKVRSGDPDNCEAQAARVYWQRLFGDDFRRDRNAPGLNAALNYSYAVIRACVARGVSAAGLHPSFSLHHKNPQNPFNLVDDLMEPLRPVADYLLWRRKDERFEALTVEIKSRLAEITTLPLPLESEAPPLSLASAKICQTFARYCLGEVETFLTPALPTPLDEAAR